MKKLAILTSLLVLTACGGGSGGGDITSSYNFSDNITMSASGLDSATFASSIASLDESLLGGADLSTMSDEEKATLAGEISNKIAALQDKYEKYLADGTIASASVPSPVSVRSARSGSARAASDDDSILTVEDVKQILRLNKLEYADDVTVDQLKEKLNAYQDRIQAKFEILENVMKPATLDTTGMTQIVEEADMQKYAGSMTLKDDVLTVKVFHGMDMKRDDDGNPELDEHNQVQFEPGYEEFEFDLSKYAMQNGKPTVPFSDHDMKEEKTQIWDDATHSNQEIVIQTHEYDQTGNLTVSMMGKQAGLKFSDFGNLMLVAKETGVRTEYDGTETRYNQDVKNGETFAFGYANKDVSKYEMADQTFTGTATGIKQSHTYQVKECDAYAYTYENEISNTSSFYNGDATLVFKAGDEPQETLTANLTNVDNASDKYKLEHVFGTDTLTETDAMGNTTEFEYARGNVKYYAENPLSGVAEEAVGLIAADSPISDDFEWKDGVIYTDTDWSVAFGVKADK